MTRGYMNDDVIFFLFFFFPSSVEPTLSWTIDGGEKDVCIDNIQVSLGRCVVK